MGIPYYFNLNPELNFTEGYHSLLEFLFLRELNIIIAAQQLPVPKKRRGKFKRGRLTKLLRHACASQHAFISTPSDFRHNITVQPERGSLRYQYSPSSPDTPPSSPSLVRLRAYSREFFSDVPKLF